MLSLSKQSVAGMRQERSRLDQNIARAVTPIIQQAYRDEAKAVADATRDAWTPDEWRRAATQAVSTERWSVAIRRVWSSEPLDAVWVAQQAAFDTDFPIPVEVRDIMDGYADEHAASIARTQRRIIDRMVTANTIPVGGKSDRLNPDRTFRSSMLRDMKAMYTDAVGRKSAGTAFTETLQATETMRYESARVSVTRTKHRTRKMWVTMGDSHVRSAHQKVNRRHVFVDHRGWGGKAGVFTVDGERLRYPRDPNGSPGNVINCRCWLEYRKVRRRDGDTTTPFDPAAPMETYQPPTGTGLLDDLVPDDLPTVGRPAPSPPRPETLRHIRSAADEITDAEARRIAHEALDLVDDALDATPEGALFRDRIDAMEDRDRVVSFFETRSDVRGRAGVYAPKRNVDTRTTLNLYSEVGGSLESPQQLASTIVHELTHAIDDQLGSGRELVFREIRTDASQAALGAMSEAVTASTTVGHAYRDTVRYAATHRAETLAESVMMEVIGLAERAYGGGYAIPGITPAAFRTEFPKMSALARRWLDGTYDN